MWITTGDSDRESAIYVSHDLGESFAIYAGGAQDYRTLMLIFTRKYLYWSMDTHKEDQKVFRAPRDDALQAIAIDELIASGADRRDPARRETVATLPYGAQWYGIKVRSTEGKPRLIFSASPESRVPETGEVPHRDWNARLFVIDDLDSDDPRVAEVASIPPVAGLTGKARRYVRLDPRCQSRSGQIYFMAHNAVLPGALAASLR